MRKNKDWVLYSFLKFDPAGKRTWDLFDLFTYIFFQFAAELEQLLKHKKLSSSEFEPGKNNIG